MIVRTNRGDDLHSELRQDRSRNVDGGSPLQYSDNLRIRWSDGSRPRTKNGNPLDLISTFAAAAARQNGQITARELSAWKKNRVQLAVPVPECLPRTA